MARKNPHAVAMGRLGGRKTSAEKTRTARLNGRAGGRPSVFPTGLTHRERALLSLMKKEDWKAHTPRRVALLVKVATLRDAK
jgi:hypothetical protein